MNRMPAEPPHCMFPSTFTFMPVGGPGRSFYLEAPTDSIGFSLLVGAGV